MQFSPQNIFPIHSGYLLKIPLFVYVQEFENQIPVKPCHKHKNTISCIYIEYFSVDSQLTVSFQTYQTIENFFVSVLLKSDMRALTLSEQLHHFFFPLRVGIIFKKNENEVCRGSRHMMHFHSVSQLLTIQIKNKNYER